jgi:hypothetical protein
MTAYFHPLRWMRGQSERIARTDDAVARLEESVGSLTNQVTGLRDELARLGRLVEEASESRTRADRDVRVAAQLAARASATPAPPYRVVFLVHHIEAWASLHGVWAAMDAAPDFEPVVVSIPRRWPGAPDYGDEQIVHAELEGLRVPHLRIRPRDLERAPDLFVSLRPDLVFRQSQWDNDIPDEFSTEAIAFAHLAYMPYETMSLIEGVERFAEATLPGIAWLVFAANELVRADLVRNGLRRGENVEVVGHPKSQWLRAAEPKWPSDGEPSRRVVWSAHHSIGTNWSRFGLFPAVAEEMIRWARTSPDTGFLFMPHPALEDFTRAPESPIDHDDYRRLLAQWTELPNTHVYSGPDYAPFLAAADLVVTDGLSMLVEPQVTATPIVFLEREGHSPFNEIGHHALAGVHRVKSVAEARAIADLLFSGAPDDLASQQQSNVRLLFPVPDPDVRVLEVLRARFASDARPAADVRAAASLAEGR